MEIKFILRSKAVQFSRIHRSYYNNLRAGSDKLANNFFPVACIGSGKKSVGYCFASIGGDRIMSHDSHAVAFIYFDFLVVKECLIINLLAIGHLI